MGTILIPDSNRLFLSYPNATYRQTRAWLIAFFVFALAAWLVATFTINVISGKPPALTILLGFAAICCLISVISDAIFVWVYQHHKNRISFDNDNLYIESRGSEPVIIPLYDITSIRLTSMMVRNTRGTGRRHRIEYHLDGVPGHANVFIYFRSRPNFARFQERTKQANPFAEINNSSWG
jgi:hypothetical protein